VVWGKPKHPAGHHDDEHGELPTDLNSREISLLTVLAVACLALGVYPTPVIEAIEPSAERTLAPYQDLLRAHAAEAGATHQAESHGATESHAQPQEGGH
jgi:NADH:ubiquinone oxidoreductase subunit 4 (subunit M)